MTDDNDLQQANRNWAIRATADALEKAGAKAPGKLAEALVEKGRVRADLSESLDSVQIRTPEGMPRINEDGEHMGVGEFAERWLEWNPELRAEEDSGGSVDASDIKESLDRRTREKTAKLLRMQQSRP